MDPQQETLLNFNMEWVRLLLQNFWMDLSLQDLDGNQVVKGSAGSVGQGASETLDELLSYKSINLRNFFSKYNEIR